MNPFPRVSYYFADKTMKTSGPYNGLLQPDLDQSDQHIVHHQQDDGVPWWYQDRSELAMIFHVLEQSI